MIFGAPWAWLGVAAIVVPILVHALTRQRAVRTPFPTLRFVPASALTAVRRHRPADLLLLLLRCAVLVTAVFALAQPYFLTATRVQGIDHRLLRATVIDTSPSMERVTDDGRRGVVAAREAIGGLTTTAADTTTIETARLAEGIAEAAAWLDRVNGTRELVVASDFQVGALTSADLSIVDRDTTIRFVRVSAVPPSTATAFGVAMTFSDDATSIEWRPDTTSTRARPVRVLSDPDERAMADASMRAATASGAPALSSTHPVTVVLPRAPEREALLTSARPLDKPWMFDVFHAVARDELVVEVTRADAGRDAVTAAAGVVDGAPTLLLFLATSDGLSPAAVLRAATRAVAPSSPLAELEPARVDDRTLAQWADASRRPARRSDGSAAPRGQSDGRWFWGLGLALLAVESFLRRRAPRHVA